WIYGEESNTMYMLQHPDPAYKPIYMETVQDWNNGPPGESSKLKLFQSVDLSAPRPHWMSPWVFKMLLLETRLIVRGTSYPLEGTDDEQDADGVSDAGSLVDHVNEHQVPTSSSWDWDLPSSAQEREDLPEAEDTYVPSPLFTEQESNNGAGWSPVFTGDNDDVGSVATGSPLFTEED
ncbi:hypothetical protein RHS04_06710, partial [Rhizoctonia solani]